LNSPAADCSCGNCGWAFISFSNASMAQSGSQMPAFPSRIHAMGARLEVCRVPPRSRSRLNRRRRVAMKRQIRAKAEQLNRAASPGLPKITPHNIEALVHELRVHQVELELQCQELKDAQAELEESRDRYRELYESIPIGYATIGGSGRIHDLNPAGMSLLGLPSTLGKLPNFMMFFVSEGDADVMGRLCRSVLREQQPGSASSSSNSVSDSFTSHNTETCPLNDHRPSCDKIRIYASTSCISPSVSRPRQACMGL